MTTYGTPGAATDADPTRSVTSMLRHWAATRPDAPMFTQDDTTVTWGEFHGRATRVAGALAAAGVVPGERVAFLDRNGIEYFEVFFGCALLGAVSVAVNWRLSPGEVSAIVEDAGAVVLVHGPDHTATVDRLMTEVSSVRRYIPLTDFAEWRDAGTAGSRPDR